MQRHGVTPDEDSLQSPSSVHDSKGTPMRRVRQQHRPSRQGRASIRFATTVAIALLILAGGAAVTVWTTSDVMAELTQQGGRSDAPIEQMRHSIPDPTVPADAARW